MTKIDLGEIEKNKYNSWCQKKILVTNNQEKIRRANIFTARTDLTPLVSSAFFFHEITGCNGFEFIAFSNIRFDEFIILPNNAILVPCFNKKMDGGPINDPRVIATHQMEKMSEFLYDGWIPIDQWDEEHVKNVIQSISETLSLFSLIFDLYFKWEPKYHNKKTPKPSYELSTKEITHHNDVFCQIRTISEEDKRAIYRSISWLSNAKKIDNAPARFLFYILAIESLVSYIEENAKNESCFSSLKFDKRTKQEKREWRNICIKEKLIDLEKNPVATISDSYFHCVKGIKATLKSHLESILPDDSTIIKLLFEEKIDERTLYELRHEIAHGSLDLLTEKQVERLNNRIGDAEKIANKYILEVLKKSLNIQFPTTITCSMLLLPENGIMYSPSSK